jgi:hypothetical protein
MRIGRMAVRQHHAQTIVSSQGKEFNEKKKGLMIKKLIIRFEFKGERKLKGV